ncbi:Hypothetical predicted protein [Cloeon dipterum]|uniref:Uncharacterized protein n=1 Tax=Cloeon dipterum TaxID=197152 RepID=A0A8S1BT55_9INSE|nr:Hypothetical predicted protein [Cloeon dipterum]
MSTSCLAPFHSKNWTSSLYWFSFAACSRMDRLTSGQLTTMDSTVRTSRLRTAALRAGIVGCSGTRRKSLSPYLARTQLRFSSLLESGLGFF